MAASKLLHLHEAYSKTIYHRILPTITKIRTRNNNHACYINVVRHDTVNFIAYIVPRFMATAEFNIYYMSLVPVCLNTMGT